MSGKVLRKLLDRRRLCASQGYTYPFLSDAKAETIYGYGVLHARAGEDGQDIARPAEFLVDATGAIRWVNLTDSVRIRVRPENALQVIDELKLTSAR